MNILVRHIIIITVISPPFILLALSSFSFLALAQEPSSFEISIIPQADYAIVGQPFTYTAVITNISQTALKDVIVRTKTPEGTTLIDTFFFNPNWFVGGVQRGEAGEVIWLTQEPVAQGEVVTFGLIVNVLPEIGRELIAEEYSVVTSENLDAPSFGPLVRTQVLTSVPTPTALPSATTAVANPPIPTVFPLTTPTSQIGSNAANKISTATSLARVEPETDSTLVSPLKTTAEDVTEEETSRVPLTIFVTIGLIILIIVIFGLARLLSRK